MHKSRLITPSQFASAFIRIPIAGAVVPISFGAARSYLPPIYNDSSKHVLMKFGRQTEKSTTIGNIALTQTTLLPGFRTLIVHPAAQQSKTFSEDRLKLPLRVSPYLRQFYPKNDQSIFHKRTFVKSSIMLRYAFLSAGRIRGIPADMLIIDEFQDILRDLIPVIEQVCFHSEHKIYLYSGTPLTEDNIMEEYWRKRSTMGEWAVPCRHHGTPKDKSSWYWNILTVKNIGKTGVICDKCGRSIDPQDPEARWVMLQSPKGREEKISWSGYHVPQLVLHFMKKAENWAELLRKLNTYSEAEFMNEVMGESCSNADIPITKDEVVSICNPKIRFDMLEEFASSCGGRIYAGVDWGTAERESFTVIAVGGYLRGSKDFQIFFIHRFIGQEAAANIYLDRICQLVNALNITHMGVDYGGGDVQTGYLMRKYGLERVHRYQYLGQRQRTGKIVHNEKMGKYLMSKAEIVSDFINAMKHKQIYLPAKEDLEKADVLGDFSSQRAVFNHTTRYLQYDRVPGRPDDAFDAVLYCLLASMFDIPRSDIITPRPELDVGETVDLINSIDMDDGIMPGMIYA
jgi:hypothetical protein